MLSPYYRNRNLIKIFSVLIANSIMFRALVVDKMVCISEERLVVTFRVIDLYLSCGKLRVENNLEEHSNLASETANGLLLS